jgi:cytochrome P450
MKQEAPHQRHSRRESSDFQSGEHVKISTDSHDQSSAPDLADDPYGFFEHMRRTEPVWRGTIMDTSMTPPELRPDEEWTLFDFESVFAAFRDDDVYGSEMYNQTIGLVFGPTILGMHGKQHHDHRSLVSKAFRQSSLERWEPAVIDPICDQLVDEIKNDGRADLVKAITFEFPTRVTAALLGLPQEDLDLFRRLSLDLISIQVDIEAGLTASVELGTYFQEQVDQRRSAMTNDIIGDLVAAEIDGEKLTDEAIISFLRLLLPAGLETTYRSSSNLLLLLLTHPDQLEALQAERDLIPAAIEEALRYETPLVSVPRTTTQDVQIHGIPIPAGAQVNLCIGSANRDETRWADAGAFDIHRPRRAHISFAGGIHSCLGMHLARVETRAMLNSLFDRVTDLQLVPDEDTKIVGMPFRYPSDVPSTPAERARLARS